MFYTLEDAFRDIHSGDSGEFSTAQTDAEQRRAEQFIRAQLTASEQQLREAKALLRRLSDNEARLEAQVTLHATLRAQKQAWADTRAFLTASPAQPDDL